MLAPLPTLPLAEAAPDAQQALRTDEVLDADAKGWRLANRSARARRALSCLVEPQAGDTVLLAEHAGEAYILAVLARPGLGDATLSLTDPAGRLTLKAQSVTLEAAASLELKAPDTSIVTTSLRLMAGAFAWLGRTCTLIGERLTTSVKESETIAETLSTKAATRLSVIERVDSEHLGAKVTNIETVAATQVQAAATSAKDDLRFDAKRISLG